MSDSKESINWSESVANDPKHRPQVLTAPSTTVRKEWSRRPQEAHLMDGDMVRRLTVEEISVIQGFPVSWFEGLQLSENDKIALLGNAVPPPVSQVIGDVLLAGNSYAGRGVIEICAGIGGLGFGFKSLEVLAQVELWDKACTVLRAHASNPATVHEMKAQDFDFRKFKGRVAGLIGGPPCQPWSQAGNKLGASDPRDVMGFTPEAVAQCEPDFFLFENVPGLITSKAHSEYVQDLVGRLTHPSSGLEYGVHVMPINCADYGVPQLRKRVFIIGIKGRSKTQVMAVAESIVKRASHADPSKPQIGKMNWVTLKEAFSGIFGDGAWKAMPTVENERSNSAITSQTATSESLQPSGIRQYTKIELGWPGKDQELDTTNGKWQFKARASGNYRHALVHSAGSSSLNPDFVIFGDEAKCLSAFRGIPKSKVGLVYMDAPRLEDVEELAPPGLANSCWLSYVRDIAQSARRLLDPHSGFFALQIDEANAHHARLVLDEVFGASCHVTTFAWEKKYSPQNDATKTTPTDSFDYISVYSVSHKDYLTPIRIQKQIEELKDDGDFRGAFISGHKGAKSGSESSKFKAYTSPYRWRLSGREKLPPNSHFDDVSGVLYVESFDEVGSFEMTFEALDVEGGSSAAKMRVNVQNEGTPHMAKDIPWLFSPHQGAGGQLRVKDLEVPGVVGRPICVVLEASGGAVFPVKELAPGEGRYWEFSKSNLRESALEARVDFGKKGTSIPSIKKYQSSDGTKGFAVRNWLPHEEYGKSEDATRQLKELSSLGFFPSDFPRVAKPEKLIAFIMDLLAPNKEHLVVSVGDMTGTLASVCLKKGRRFAHLVGASPESEKIYSSVAKARWKAVVSNADKLGLDYDPIELSPEISDFRLSMTKIWHLEAQAIATVESFSQGEWPSFQASCVGCCLPTDVENVFKSECGTELAVILAQDEVVDSTQLAEISRTYTAYQKIYVIGERWEMPEGDLPPSRIVALRSPNDLK